MEDNKDRNILDDIFDFEYALRKLGLRGPFKLKLSPHDFYRLQSEAFRLEADLIFRYRERVEQHSFSFGNVTFEPENF